MKLTWLGHACFVLENSEGRKLMTDPFDASVGYPLPGVEVEVVTVSHSHFDHAAIDVVPGDNIIVRDTEPISAAGFKILGVDSFHDDEEGGLRGRNRIYVIQADGVRICHCGDLGHLLSDKEADAIGEIDVLLIPVGGVYTINAEKAAVIVERLKPRVTIPMHYKTPVLKFELEPVDEFLKHYSNYQQLETNTIQLTPETLDSYKPVVVLAPPA